MVEAPGQGRECLSMEEALRNLFSNKWFWSVLAVLMLIVLLVSTSRPAGGLNVLRNLLSVPLTPLQRVYSNVSGKVGGFISEMTTLREAQTQNDALRERIRLLEQENLEMEALKRQNDEFLKLLDFKTRYADYGFLGATIIGKAAGNWFHMFTIDRGMKDGLRNQSGYPVIAGDGLVGRIRQIDLLSSEVVSLIDLDSTVSVRVARTRDLLVVRGDITLKEEGLCRVDYIPPNADLMPGDVLETSGMGNVYPKGIRVGVVSRIVRNQGQMDAYAILEPAVDFKRIEEVVVLTPLPGSTDDEVDGENDARQE